VCKCARGVFIVASVSAVVIVNSLVVIAKSHRSP
jgi:hypothetical protein